MLIDFTRLLVSRGGLFDATGFASSAVPALPGLGLKSFHRLCIGSYLVNPEPGADHSLHHHRLRQIPRFVDIGLKDIIKIADDLANRSLGVLPVKTTATS